MHDITDEEWKEVQQRRERREHVKNRIEEYAIQMRETFKDIPTDVLTCKYYTDDEYMRRIGDVARAAMFKEICRRRKEELKSEQPVNS